MLYFFILGKNPALSTAEIASQINGKIINLSDSFLTLQSDKKIDANFWQERLGGTIKIGVIIDEVKNFKPEEAVKILKGFRRPHFGFSFYGLNNQFIARAEKLAMEIKKQLKEKNLSSRWVVAKEKILSSVIVQKNKLLTDGAEFVFLMDKEKSYFGQTISCQQFEDYSWRDFGRPVRKIEEGMLPPKLAKIMINLAQAPENGIILDPFCGSGTIIQEAILMGYQNVIGTDIAEEAIKSSRENIEWLLENYKIQNPNVKQITKSKIQIFQHDVRSLSQKIPPNSIDAIVTEPYLGPLKITNYKLPITNLLKELSDLYLATFAEFKRILKKDGRIVMIFPVFRIGNQLTFLPILDELKKSGWQVINPLPESLRKNPIIKITPRNSIIYSRQDQTILREIFILEPTS